VHQETHFEERDLDRLRERLDAIAGSRRRA
jgi:hypothetical protein